MASATDRYQYTVGWIAPMSLELTAATAMLEEPTELRVPEDNTVYNVGRIGHHYVVMVVCPRIGTNPASIVLTNMRRSFPNITHVLLVGIGGGVPCYGVDLEKQIVLGDVVVGFPQDSEGGVAHTEFGAWVGKNEFAFSGHTLHPSSALLGAVNNLQSQHEKLQGTFIPQILREMRNGIRADLQPEFKDPGPEHDRLFQDDCPHLDKKKSCDVLCELDKSTLREKRGPKAHREKDTPFVHYGTINSENALVISSAKRNDLYEKRGTICFEMEAAAIVSECQGLVVRGICDYADSHKNKKWQRYAAATAAAYTKELLSVLPAADVAKTRTVEKQS
jgi:nucleoside phosphorylase